MNVHSGNKKQTTFSTPCFPRWGTDRNTHPDLFIFQFCFVFEATHSSFTPSGPLMLLPRRQWTKEPPSAGFRGRCSGGLAANKESKWRENGSWRRRTPRETRSHVKYGPGVHSCGCFSSLLLFLPLCSMSPSPHVCLWFSSFMPWPALCVPPLWQGRNSAILSITVRRWTKTTGSIKNVGPVWNDYHHWGSFGVTIEAHLALWCCVCHLFHFQLSASPRLCIFGKCMCTQTACQIPLSCPEFREQPLVVLTLSMWPLWGWMWPSLTEGHIHPLKEYEGLIGIKWNKSFVFIISETFAKKIDFTSMPHSSKTAKLVNTEQVHFDYND